MPDGGLSLINEAGPLVWPLLGLSLYGFVIFVERTIFLHKAQIRTEEYVKGIKNLLTRRRLVEALTICEETPGPVASILKAALLHYNEAVDEMRGAIQAAAIVEIPNVERRVAAIGAIVGLAPLLGLIGTVAGMIEAFFLIESMGNRTDLTFVMAAYREALLTTAIGLVIAAMAFLAHHFLTARVRSLVQDMEWVGNDIMQFLKKGLPAEEDDDNEVDTDIFRKVAEERITPIRSESTDVGKAVPDEK